MGINPRVTEDVDLARLLSIYEQSIGEHHASASAFVASANSIDWSTKDAATFKHAVDMALSLNAIRFARQLATQGHKMHPESDDLARLAQVIASPKVIESSPPASPGVGASVAWLQQHKGEYMGTWVALKNGELLGTAPTRDALIDQLGPITIEDRILVTRMG